MNRKWLKRLGLVLIVSPEPFTTPAGVALLGAAHLLSKRQKTKNDRRARELVSFYLARAKGLNDRVHHGTTSKKVIHHTLNRNLSQYDNDGSFHDNSQRLNSPDVPTVSQKVVHHSLNRGFPRYSNAGGSST